MADEKRCVCGEYYTGPDSHCPICNLEAAQSMETPEPAPPETVGGEPGETWAAVMEEYRREGHSDKWLWQRSKAHLAALTPSIPESEPVAVDSRSCQACGGDIDVLWHAPESIWTKISPEPHTPGTDDGGVLCVSCAGKRAEAAGITLIFYGVDLSKKEALFSFVPAPSVEPEGAQEALKKALAIVDGVGHSGGSHYLMEGELTLALSEIGDVIRTALAHPEASPPSGEPTEAEWLAAHLKAVIDPTHGTPLYDISFENGTSLTEDQVKRVIRCLLASSSPAVTEEYAVRCLEHGLTPLTLEEYTRQLDDPDSLWVCPICREPAEWDDETYEAALTPSIPESEPVAIWQKHWRFGRAGVWEDEDEKRCKLLAGKYANEWKIRVVYTHPPVEPEGARAAAHATRWSLLAARVTLKQLSDDPLQRQFADAVLRQMASVEEELPAHPKASPPAVQDTTDDRPTELCADTSFGDYQNQVSMNPPASLELRGPIGIDLCLASEIAGLWARGIQTLSSCCGHGRLRSFIGVSLDNTEAMRALGYQRDERNPEVFAFTAKSGCTPEASPPAGDPK